MVGISYTNRQVYCQKEMHTIPIHHQWQLWEFHNFVPWTWKNIFFEKLKIDQEAMKRIFRMLLKFHNYMFHPWTLNFFFKLKIFVSNKVFSGMPESLLFCAHEVFP